jgi:shikimate dehydrogenase
MAELRHFGLIGHPVAHSLSARYFEQKWAELGLDDCRYTLHDLPDVDDLPALWESRRWAGMNVTVPHKQAVMDQLDGLSPEAEAIGAVNTIAFTPAGRIGHNTDAVGFRRSIAPFLEGHHDSALVLGTGGSSAAVVHVLRAIGIDVTRVSRNPTAPGDIAYTDIGREGLAATPLLVNCTPVGMHPDVGGIPPLSEAALGGFGPGHFVVDLIYSPRETALMKRASALGARTLDGFSMLHLQADAAWEIWTGGAAAQ